MARLESHPFVNHLVSPLEIRLAFGSSAWVPRCSYRFKVWKGKRVSNTYGGKTLVGILGKPLFAELAILRVLQSAGWSGVWVDTYGRKFRQHLAPHECPLPAHAKLLFDKICSENDGNRSGCFDVFAWKAGKYLFVESKRRAKDSIRPTQMAWVAAALKSGVPMESLLICEWDL